MIGVAEYGTVKGRGRPGCGKRQKPREGSRKFVVLSDGSTVKWWGGEWRFYATRWNSKVATSLQMRAMNVAEQNGRMQRVEERFRTFEDFVERMVKVVGLDALIKIVQHIQG